MVFMHGYFCDARQYCCVLTYAGNARLAYYILLSCPQLHPCLPPFYHKMLVYLLIRSDKALDLCISLSIPAESGPPDCILVQKDISPNI